MHLKSIVPSPAQSNNRSEAVESGLGDQLRVETDFIEWSGRNIIAVLGWDARINVDSAGARDLAAALLKLADHVDGIAS